MKTTDHKSYFIIITINARRMQLMFSDVISKVIII